MAIVKLEIPESLKTRYQALAELKKYSVEELVLEAMGEYLEIREPRMHYIQEGKEALEDIRKTGLHLTQEEVFDWISSWGTKDSKDAPECHK